MTSLSPEWLGQAAPEAKYPRFTIPATPFPSSASGQVLYFFMPQIPPSDNLPHIFMKNK